VAVQKCDQCSARAQDSDKGFVVGGSDVRDGYDFAVRPLESHSDDEDGEQQYHNV
jgi:hypothetical protein